MKLWLILDPFPKGYRKMAEEPAIEEDGRLKTEGLRIHGSRQGGARPSLPAESTEVGYDL